MQLLYPECRPTSPDELAAGLRLGDKAPPDRPYLVLNMVSSLDGKATIDWRTKGLSTELDRQLFHRLRTQGDAIMVGAGTVRAERYGRMAKSDELRDAREREGLEPDPLAVVVSARLDLPADLPLLNEPEQRVVIATGSDASLPEASPARSIYERTGDDLPLLAARLRHEHGVRSVVCEGGPTLNSLPALRRPRGRALAHAQPQARGRRRGADDRGGPRAGRAGRSGADLRGRGRRRPVHPLARQQPPATEKTPAIGAARGAPAINEPPDGFRSHASAGGRRALARRPARTFP